MTLNTHPENETLAKKVANLAQAIHLGVTRYSTSYAKFDGVHRYAVYMLQTPDGTPDTSRPFGTRSKRVIAYFAARYSRYYLPSIKGERAALSSLYTWLKTNEEN